MNSEPSKPNIWIEWKKYKYNDTGYSMINKTTRGFILILVAAFLSGVEGDDLQEIHCKGKTND